MMFSSSPSPSILGELSLPTSTLEPVSSSTPSIWGVRSFLHLRRGEGSSQSSFPAAWERRDAVPVPSSILPQVQTSLSVSSLENSQATTTSQHNPSKMQDAEETLATQVTVGSQPDICKSAFLTWEKEMLVPLGIVRLKPKTETETDVDVSGWGKAGTIWNITTGGGAKLVDMKAQCQGRICSVNDTDEGRPAVESGIMKQRPDGSWYMEVTPHMQDLMVSGKLMADTVGDPNQTYPLHVSSKLACWLPVAQNSTEESFHVNLTQWRAYDVPRFLKKILKDGPTSYYDFGDMLMKKGLPAQDAIAQECSIDQMSHCRRPMASDYARRPDADHVADLMLIDAYFTFLELMSIFDSSVERVSNKIGTLIESLVTHIWKEAAEQVWDKPKPAAVASNAVGLGIGLAVALQVIFAFLIPVAAPEILVAGAAVDTAVAEGVGAGAAVAAGAGRAGGQAAAEAGEAAGAEAAGAGAGAAGAAGRTAQTAEEAEAAAAADAKAATAGEEAAAAGKGEAAAAGEGKTAAENASKGTAQKIKDGFNKHATNFMGLIVAASIFGSNGAGLYANLDTMKSDPEAPDAQMRAALHYKLQAQDILNQTQVSLSEALESKDTGSDAIQKMFEGGQWIDEDFRKNMTKEHLGPKIEEWYERQMGGDTLSRFFSDGKIYVLFFEYDKSGESWWINEKVPFTQKECEEDWVGNSKWKFAATCDIPYHPGGPLGMAVLVRTLVKGQGLVSTETKQMFENPMEFQGSKIDARNVIASMMHGQALGGFGYTVRNNDWTKGIADMGLGEAMEKLLDKDPAQPGLYVGPVCKATKNLVYAPGSWVGMFNFRKRSNPESWLSSRKRSSPDGPYGGKYANYAKTPCPCRNWWYQAAGGEKRFFRDYVRSDLVDAMDNDCAHGTGFHGGTYKDTIDIPN